MATKRKKSTKEKNKGRPVLKHFLVNKLRRISYSWPPRKTAIQKARVSRGKYRCAICKGEQFGPKDIQADHVEAVIDPHEGFTTWDSYIERLFCAEEGIQILCRPCHDKKTFYEDAIRKQVKQEKKKYEGDDDI